MARYDSPAKKEAWATLVAYAKARNGDGPIPIARVYRLCYDWYGKYWAECFEEDYERIIEKGEDNDVSQ